MRLLGERMETESSSLKEYNGIVIESKELFKNDSSIRIVHGNDVYILRITKGNKLILTK
ncbi:hemin uptake protein HemP [Sulfuricurvum sp. IAE1]|jgi:hemin uptake protein HemP|nr:hemin uptake protein HemP [Sulfuricurvum sp. IAE1]